VSVGADGDAEGSRQAEVGQLDVSLSVDEQILRLQVAVEDAMFVAVVDAVEQLPQVALEKVGGCAHRAVVDDDHAVDLAAQRKLSSQMLRRPSSFLHSLEAPPPRTPAVVIHPRALSDPRRLASYGAHLAAR